MLAAFRVRHMEQDAAAHGEHVHALLAVILPIIDPLDRERIAKRRADGLEGDTVVTLVRSSLVGISPITLLHGGADNP